MKKILLFAFSLCLFSSVFAQKFGYVDTEFILKQLPEYKEAQQEIDKLSVQYQKQIEKKYVSLDSLFNAFRQEEILLTEEMKREKQNEIMLKEKEIKEFQKKIFGYEGLIFLKRQELIKPIQDKVYDAVKKVAEREKLQVVFDKASDLVMIYANPVHDYTDYVLEELKLGDKKDIIDNKR
ncbi:MAG: OmpH family outer membrane protein [Cytophagales bacterium]|nr:OmpH family outer membrane protein [Cytophagales bacterium]